MELHGGEVWCQADADGGGARVRLLLPLVESMPPPRPAPARRPEARPEFYDFDLFRAAERAEEWDQRRLDELDYTLFDTETTGLNPSEGDEILSIGAVRIVNGRLLRQETFDQLVDPRRPVSPQSVSIHGISPRLLEGQPTIDEALPPFARFCEGTVLVGHNVGFDMRFLELKEAQTGVRLTQPVLDTLLLDAVAAPEEQDHSLEAIAARLGVSVVGRHTALGDAILTGEIFLKQLRLLAAQGFVTLGETRVAARSTYLARRSESLYSRA
jgi:DNA polymerase-3 subunit epsilon